jgi:DNA-binding beta-propeller fold protein YncE
MTPLSRRRALQHSAAGLLGLAATAHAQPRVAAITRRLYVATPGIRDYLEYGGHGLLVFDIDNGHKFVKRIPTQGLSPEGKPLNVKGICACSTTRRVYISTTKQLMCLDLTSEKLLWEKPYEAGCDRMSITPDGSAIYLPSFEGPIWNVVDARDGAVLSVIKPNSGAHNTIVGPDGREAYLAGLRSPLLTIADCASHSAVRTVGPFSAPVRPFTVNGRQTLVFVNVNELLGFEVGDLKSGKVLHRVEVSGFSKGPVKRHGCPSHGIGLTPDETELWVADAHNQHLHIFDTTKMPPIQKGSIKLKDEPGWVTFSIDGTLAYPSTGEVIEVKSKQVVAELRDEEGRGVQSEKLLEIDFRDQNPARSGNQFGIGQIGAPDGIAP